MKFIIKALLISSLCCVSNLTQAQQVLPSSRSVDWTKAGLQNVNTDGFTIIDMQNFNVVGNGTTANDQFLSNAIATIGSNGAVLVFPSGNFLFNSTISLPSNVVLKGAGAKATTFTMNLSGANHAISIKGNISNSDTTTFSQSSLQNDNHINVTAAGSFSAGDWIQIFQDDTSLITSSWAANTVGQIVQIESVIGNKINLKSPLRIDYALAKAPYIHKILPVENVGIECLKIVRVDDTAPSQTSSIFFEYAVNSWVKGIESEKTTFSHVEAKSSSNLYISKSYFHHAFDYGGNGRAYGVVLHYTTNETLVENNIFEHLRHSMLVQAGANANVFAFNYSRDAFWSSTPNDSAGDIVLHGNYPYANLFENNIVQNIVIDNSHGPNGLYNTFLRNRAENYGIFFSANNSPGQNFIGNEITRTSFPQNLVNYTILGSNHFIYGNNNNKGTITPSGTNTLTDESYAYASKPNFVSAQLWASVGTPNVMNSGSIPAKDRFDSSEIFNNDSCNQYTLNVSEVEASTISVFPNPIVSTIQIQSKNVIATMKVIDQQGRVVYEERINSTVKKINVSKLQSGIYFVKLMFDNNQSVTKKILKL